MNRILAFLIAALTSLSGLFAVPVRTPPADLSLSVTDGVFMAASAVDSQFTPFMLSVHEEKDGSLTHVLVFSMNNPWIRKLWPSLHSRIYPDAKRGMEIILDLANPPEPPEPPDGPFGLPPPELPDFPPTLDGKGLWLVYFARDRDLKHIQANRSTGRLTAKSMLYATLVWEETVA